MTTAEDEEKKMRGQRVLAIRVALGMTGEQFADALNEVAEVLGFPRYWTGPKVTNTEKGKRDVQLSDLAILEATDPEKRPWHWIAFGAELPKVPRRTATGAKKLDLRKPQRGFIPPAERKGKGA